MEVKTIKTTDYGYVRLYGYRPKSVTAGLAYGIGCTQALSVTTAPLGWHMCQLQHYKLTSPISITFTFCLRAG